MNETREIVFRNEIIERSDNIIRLFNKGIDHYIMATDKEFFKIDDLPINEDMEAYKAFSIMRRIYALQAMCKMVEESGVVESDDITQVYVSLLKICFSVENNHRDMFCSIEGLKKIRLPSIFKLRRNFLRDNLLRKYGDFK